MTPSPPGEPDPTEHELAGASASSPRPDRPVRPVRTPRAAPPDSLGVARAVAGAAVAVAGVVLGIGTLLWVSEDPSQSGPAVQASTGGPVVTSPAAEPEAVTPVTPPASTAVPTTAPPTVAAPAPPLPPPPPPAPLPPAPPAAAPARSLVIPVTVLNNSRREGLAAAAAERFEAGGWPVRETGSLRGRIRATTVYYAPGQEASARAFAAEFRGIERVLPRIEGLPGTGLTVVLTRDFPI